jgi:hypothetical protein
MSVVTKSGTNNLSGSAFYFGRNQDLNSRNFSRRRAPSRPYSQMRGGGSLGGRSSRIETHFFGAVRDQPRRLDEHRLPAGRQPFAPLFNGQWPSGSDNQMVDGRSITGSATSTRCSCATPTITRRRRADRLRSKLELRPQPLAQHRREENWVVSNRW